MRAFRVTLDGTLLPRKALPSSPTNRLLLIGASGQVGSALLPRLSELGEVSAPRHSQLDLASEESIRAAVRSFQPDVIINAAAYTAVDLAESQPDLAMRVNAGAPGILAVEARQAKALLVHYSTDYVFDGTKRTPYREEDTTAPRNEYGRTKLLGEQRVAAAGGAYLILRTGWIYASQGKNFLVTMLRLGAEREMLRIVDDQIGTPTPAAVVADATLRILEFCRQHGADMSEYLRSLAGIYHVGCAGQTSWFRFALAIFEQARSMGMGARLRVTNVVPTTTEEYPTPAQRPRYSVLSKEKIIRTYGVQPPPWEDGLARVMRQVARPDLKEEPVP